MTTRLDMALQRLEAVVKALETNPPAPSGAQAGGDPSAAGANEFQAGEINAIRQLVDRAMVILAEENNQSQGAGGDADD